MITILIVIAILVLLIVTHEFGHFIMAKIFGVRVDEFGVGYPPRAFSFGKWGGTEYTLNWIPFGGFVRLYGEDADAHGRGSFVEAKRWKQAIILVAGVAMNAIVAWLLFAAALHTGIPQVVDAGALPPGTHAHLDVSDVISGSPASAAGIVAGDEILGMTDQAGVTLSTLTPESVSDFVKTRGGKEITIVYLHDDATSTAMVVPANAVIPGAAATPALGVGLVEVENVSLSWGQALWQGLSNTRDAFETVGSSLWQLLTGVFHGSADLQDVVGPVGLVGVVGQAAQNGAGDVLALAGFIAVNLAIINLIPIPALDGGRLVVVAFEAITRRKAPALLIQILNTIGIALIILLMLTVTYHDIARLLT
jgi:regulator of sigma E protease